MSSAERPEQQGHDAAADQVPADVPERLAARMVSLAGDALGDLAPAHVPAPLRQVAKFTPARRARLGGAAIAELLEVDEEFRAHVAVQVRARHRRVAEALDAGDTTLDTAALAMLERSEGWTDLVATFADQDARSRAEQTERTESARAETLARRVDDLQQELRDNRTRQRTELDRLRGDNTDLRRKLGDTRAELRRAREQAADVEAERDRLRAERDHTDARADAELRRVRSRVEALESEVERAQRGQRAERDDATLRARLLMETLLQAAQGLRTELALPVVEDEPADRVAARMDAETVSEMDSETDSGTGSGTAADAGSSGHGSLAPGDPRLLAQLLELPRVHVIVDGYNVTKTVWPDIALSTQRDRLLRGVAAITSRTSASMTVVFDAGQAEQRPVGAGPRGVRVLFSASGQIADDLIRDLVEAEPEGRPVVVVTDDGAVVADVRRRAGVRTAGSRALAGLIGRV